jgi:hypothetical protein
MVKMLQFPADKGYSTSFNIHNAFFVVKTLLRFYSRQQLRSFPPVRAAAKTLASIAIAIKKNVIFK